MSNDSIKASCGERGKYWAHKLSIKVNPNNHFNGIKHSPFGSTKNDKLRKIFIFYISDFRFS